MRCYIQYNTGVSVSSSYPVISCPRGGHGHSMDIEGTGKGREVPYLIPGPQPTSGNQWQPLSYSLSLERMAYFGPALVFIYIYMFYISV